MDLHRRLPLPPSAAWTLLLDPACTTAWFDPQKGFPVVEGAAFLLPDGTTGVVGTVRPADQLSFTWQPEGWERPAHVQLRFEAVEDGRTLLAVHAEGVPRAASIAFINWWEDAVDSLTGAAGHVRQADPRPTPTPRAPAPTRTRRRRPWWGLSFLRRFLPLR